MNTSYWDKQKFVDEAKDPEKVHMIIELLKSSIDEVKFHIGRLEQYNNDRLNRSVGVLTVGGLIFLITLNFAGKDFLKLYLVWSLPFLLFAISSFFVSLLKRKYFPVQAMPMVVEDGEKEVGNYYEILSMYKEIWSKLQLNYNKSLPYQTFVFVGSFLYILSFCIYFYIYFFIGLFPDIIYLEMIVSIVLLCIGHLIYYNFINKSFIKTIHE